MLEHKVIKCQIRTRWYSDAFWNSPAGSWLSHPLPTWRGFSIHFKRSWRPSGRVRNKKYHRPTADSTSPPKLKNIMIRMRSSYASNCILRKPRTLDDFGRAFGHVFLAVRRSNMGCPYFGRGLLVARGTIGRHAKHVGVSAHVNFWPATGHEHGVSSEWSWISSHSSTF